MDDINRVKLIKHRFENIWMAISEISSVGIGEIGNEYGIIILVKSRLEEIKKIFPEKIENIRIECRKEEEIVSFKDK